MSPAGTRNIGLAVELLPLSTISKVSSFIERGCCCYLFFRQSINDVESEEIMSDVLKQIKKTEPTRKITTKKWMTAFVFHIMWAVLLSTSPRNPVRYSWWHPTTLICEPFPKWGLLTLSWGVSQAHSHRVDRTWLKCMSSKFVSVKSITC